MMSFTKPWKNPVIVKEIRTRMRGNRAFILLTIHLILVTLAVGLIYVVFQSSLSSGNSQEGRRMFGKVLFGLILWLELVTISFIAPALTSGAISLERERQTFDLLRVTLLPARELVLGKYASGLVFIFLLLFTSIPLYGPAYLAGGVILEEILIGILVLGISAIAFCAVGILFSSLLPRTLLSTVLSYAFAIFIVFGIPIIFAIVLIIFGISTNGSFNAFSPLAQAILLFTGWLLVSITPLATIIATEILLLDQHSIFLAKITLPNQATVTLISPWIPYVMIYICSTIFILWLSIRTVKRIET